MLEDRLDMRLQGDPDDPVSLSTRWRMTRQEREAEAFENVAALIEAGDVKIRGVRKSAVLDRLQARADGCRDGSDRHQKSVLPRKSSGN